MISCIKIRDTFAHIYDMRWLVWNWKLKRGLPFMGEVEGTINEE